MLKFNFFHLFYGTFKHGLAIYTESKINAQSSIWAHFLLYLLFSMPDELEKAETLNAASQSAVQFLKKEKIRPQRHKKGKPLQ
jgi:hypothetical protein